MTKFLQIKISDIRDADFGIFIDELCTCFNWNPEEFQNKTLANLFSACVMHGKTPNLSLIPCDIVLSKKFKSFDSDSVIYQLCCELVCINKLAMDNMLGKSVFAVVKKCYKAVNPPLKLPKPSSFLHLKHKLDTKIIEQRRRNEAP